MDTGSTVSRGTSVAQTVQHVFGHARQRWRFVMCAFKVPGTRRSRLGVTADWTKDGVPAKVEGGEGAMSVTCVVLSQFVVKGNRDRDCSIQPSLLALLPHLHRSESYFALA